MVCKWCNPLNANLTASNHAIWQFRKDYVILFNSFHQCTHRNVVRAVKDVHKLERLVDEAKDINLRDDDFGVSE